jgi:hypothetical protein
MMPCPVLIWAVAEAADCHHWGHAERQVHIPFQGNAFNTTIGSQNLQLHFKVDIANPIDYFGILIFPERVEAEKMF